MCKDNDNLDSDILKKKKHKKCKKKRALLYKQALNKNFKLCGLLVFFWLEWLHVHESTTVFTSSEHYSTIDKCV